MFIEESLWVKAVLSNLELPMGCTVLDIGSSTTQFRQAAQPHIDSNVFYPLRQRGCRIYYLDAKQREGVDIVCDIVDPNVDPIGCIGMQFDLVICANLLEHVLNVNRVARIAVDIVKDKGYLLVTVPLSYGKHPDPIDTMFRPSPGELEVLFRSVEPAIITTVAKVIIINHRMYYPVHESRYPLWGYRDVLRYLFLPSRWKVSCVLFQKRGLA